MNTFFNVGRSELIFSVIGLAIGIAIAVIRARYWKTQIIEHEETNLSLYKACKKKDAKIKDQNTTIQKHKENFEKLGARARDQISERDQAINQLKDQGTTLESQLTAMSTRVEKAQKNIKELESILRLKETEIEALQSRSEDQESTITKMRNQTSEIMEKIQVVTSQINDRDQTITQLQEKISARDRAIEDWKTHSENTQTKILEMETMYNEKEQVISTLETRIRSMQDNLTIISGIGPKVSAVLRIAGINTFSKLAELNAKKIKNILETENPRLLQLVDPTTWPEQAGLASKGEWEILKSLQDSLKGKRSTLADEIVDMEQNQITSQN